MDWSVKVDDSTGQQLIQVGLPVLDGGKPIGSIVLGCGLTSCARGGRGGGHRPMGNQGIARRMSMRGGASVAITVAAMLGLSYLLHVQ